LLVCLFSYFLYSSRATREAEGVNGEKPEGRSREAHTASAADFRDQQTRFGKSPTVEPSPAPPSQNHHPLAQQQSLRQGLLFLSGVPVDDFSLIAFLLFLATQLPSIVGFEGLQVLNLSFNLLEALPETLASLSNLKFVSSLFSLPFHIFS
jgi:hypothetical protein